MSSLNSDQPPEIAQLSRAYWTFFSNWTSVKYYIDMAWKGWNSFSEEIHEFCSSIMSGALNDVKEKLEDNSDAMEALSLLHKSGLPEKAKTETANKMLTRIERVAKAAVIVFDHSILDNLLFEFIKITSSLSPDDWDKKISDRQVRYSEIANQPKETIRDELMSKYISKVEKESLILKARLIYALCKPPTDYSMHEKYRFSQGDLEEFDRRRHEVIHRSGFSSADTDIAQIHLYTLATAAHFFSLLEFKYGKIPVHPNNPLSGEPETHQGQ